MLNQFGGLECYKEDVCNPDTCRFARIPDDWVKYIGYDNLCDLVYDYIKYGPDLNPPNGGDAMGRRMPAMGSEISKKQFCLQDMHIRTIQKREG